MHRGQKQCFYPACMAIHLIINSCVDVSSAEVGWVPASFSSCLVSSPSARCFCLVVWLVAVGCLVGTSWLFVAFRQCSPGWYVRSLVRGHGHFEG